VTQAIPIPSQPYLNIPSADYLRPEVLETYEHIEDVPYPLQAMETVMVYIDNSGNVFHLNGPFAGREGVRLHQNIQGEHHLFFEQVTTESAYQFGSTIERVNYLARKINLRVFIGAPGMNNITYRACEDRFWAGQDEVKGGWFGVFTRYSGWRWIRVWPARTVDTTQRNDPVMYDNNQAIWDINWLSPIPYYSTPALMTEPWLARKAGAPDKDGYYHGTLAIPNLGDIGSYVEYLLTDCAGSVVLQDNIMERTQTIEQIFASDGQITVSTDPTEKTLVSEHDPHDNEFYKLLRATGLANFLLTPTSALSGEALWLRQYIRFMYQIPPQTVAHLHVKANNPEAQIVARLTQRYKRSR
jgi:hypothetical protein